MYGFEDVQWRVGQNGKVLNVRVVRNQWYSLGTVVGVLDKQMMEIDLEPGRRLSYKFEPQSIMGAREWWGVGENEIAYVNWTHDSSSEQASPMLQITMSVTDGHKMTGGMKMFNQRDQHPIPRWIWELNLNLTLCCSSESEVTVYYQHCCQLVSADRSPNPLRSEGDLLDDGWSPEGKSLSGPPGTGKGILTK